MPSIMSILMLAIAGISIFTGLNYVTFARSDRQRPQHMLFGLLCLIAGVYFITVLYGYKSGTRAALIFSSRWAGILSALMAMIIPWFCANFGNWKPRKFLAGLTAVWGIIVVITFSRPFGLLWTRVDNIVERITPWHETLYGLTGTISQWGYLRYAAYAATIGFGMVIVFRLYRVRDFRHAILLMIPTLVAIAALFNDTLLDLGRIHSLYFISYVFLAFIIVIGYDLEYNRLRAQTNYHTLFDAITDTVTVHDAFTGRILDANQAAARMFGTTIKALLASDLSRTILPPSFAHGPAKEQILRTPQEDTQLIERQIKRISDGREFWAETALRTEKIDGRPVVLAVTRDITGRKQAEEELRKSEDRFRKIVEQAPIAMAVVGMDGSIEYINRKAIKVFGYLPEDIPTMERWWIQAYPDESYRKEVVADWTGRIQKALTECSDIVGNEYQVTCKNGDVKTMFISGVPVSDKIFVMFDDITEPKQAEEELRKSKEVLELIFKISPDISVITRLSDGLITDINERFVTMSGYAREEAVGKTSVELNLYEDADSRRKIVEELGRKGYYENYETVFRTKSGNKFIGIISSQVLTLQGTPHIYSIIRDITERKHIEDALRESEQRFKELAETLPNTIYILDVDSRKTTYFNKDEFIGYSRAELMGPGSIFHEVHPDDTSLVLEQWQQTVSGKKAPSVEYRIRDKKGNWEWLQSQPVVFSLRPDGAVKEIIMVLTVVSVRKRAEEALLASEMRYRELADLLPQTLFETDMEGKLTFANQAAFAIFGYNREDFEEGIYLTQILMPEEHTRLRENLRKKYEGEQFQSSEYTARKKDGSAFPVLTYTSTIIKNGGIIGTRGIVVDITYLKRAEKELAKLDKLEALGIVAGGIAHDFNNLLTGIFGYVDLARSVSKDEQAKEYLEATLTSMNRAKALTLQLLTFAKGGVPVQKITPLISFIQETAKFALSGSNVSCRFFLAEDLWPCYIDKNQIGQVIDNIVINAKQAMSNGGNIEIAAKNISLGEEEHPLMAKGDYVKVSIKDSGIGIPKDAMPRIFDPFYTTKTSGHGLGLATCYSIIKRHGGAINVESEPGEGSTFHVYLPASTEAAPVETAETGRHKGSGTILVMDDEEMILNLTRKMLETMGYDVVCMNNGKAVLDFFASDPVAGKKVVGMLFDLTIPDGMGGIEAAAEIRKPGAGVPPPKVPIIVLSGYSNDPVMKNPGKYGFTRSLSKPFTFAELSGILNSLFLPNPSKR